MRCVAVVLILLAGWVAQAVIRDTTADRVFGQPGLSHNTASDGEISCMPRLNRWLDSLILLCPAIEPNFVLTRTAGVGG